MPSVATGRVNATDVGRDTIRMTFDLEYGSYSRLRLKIAEENARLPPSRSRITATTLFRSLVGSWMATRQDDEAMEAERPAKRRARA